MVRPLTPTVKKPTAPIFRGQKTDLFHNDRLNQPQKRGQLSPTGPQIVGYSSGGATVTQTTSKLTGVIIDAPCGQIITTADNLANGAVASFVVSNNQVEATDTIILNLATGYLSSGSYNYQVEGVGAGGFTIWFKNISGIGLAEALTWNFAIVKATNAP